MTSLTVRNLDEHIKARLRLRAARHGWSMEQEVRNILREAVAPDADPEAPTSFAERIRQRFAHVDASDLPIPARRASRTPPSFDPT